MFRHKGKRRTYSHNLRLASILSFVAGIVNVTGVLALKTLTTNVTGHFAYFSEEMVLQHYPAAFVLLLYILAFFMGAFFSNLIIEIFSRNNAIISYVLPLSAEITLLSVLAILGTSFFDIRLIAFILLFAMGLQNALVTKVSNSVVRTTHLTGLFTDLGIEISQLIFHRKNKQNVNKLIQSIHLKLAIICCFFAGCILAGVLFGEMQLYTLMIAVIALIIALCYDDIRLYYFHLKRKLR